MTLKTTLWQPVRPLENLIAVQITEQNIADVAIWCGGTVHAHTRKNPTTRLHRTDGIPALVGDWLSRGTTSGRFRVHPAGRLPNGYEPVDNIDPAALAALDDHGFR